MGASVGEIDPSLGSGRQVWRNGRTPGSVSARRHRKLENRCRCGVPGACGRLDAQAANVGRFDRAERGNHCASHTTWLIYRPVGRETGVRREQGRTEAGKLGRAICTLAGGGRRVRASPMARRRAGGSEPVEFTYRAGPVSANAAPGCADVEVNGDDKHR